MSGFINSKDFYTPANVVQAPNGVRIMTTGITRTNIVDFTNKKVVRFGQENQIEVGQRIQNRRKELGISATDFAWCIGIGKDMLSRIETGKNPCKMENLYVISQYLDVSADYLLFGERNCQMRDKISEILCALSDRQLSKAKKVLEAVFE